MEELLSKAPELERYYILQDNGFYKCIVNDAAEKKMLKELFLNVGFSALNFTDSRSRYQFYALKHLWKHIETARCNGLKRLNITTPPLSVAEVYKHLCGKEFENVLSKPPYSYDLRSKHCKLFGGDSGYLLSREQVLEDISSFVKEETEEDR